jgi:hypothetical protein
MADATASAALAVAGITLALVIVTLVLVIRTRAELARWGRQPGARQRPVEPPAREPQPDEPPAAAPAEPAREEVTDLWGTPLSRRRRR